MRTLILCYLATLAAPSLAAPSDSRVQILPFDTDQVVTLPVKHGFAAVIELASDETIENVVVGNSAAWEVIANSSGDRIIVKPLPGAVSTNMILITQARRYVFLLDPAFGGTDDLFVVRFTYEQDSPRAPATPMATYRFGGAKRLFPAAMRDDGQRTTISWDEQGPLPAIFALGSGGRETVVNGRMVGSSFVAEGIAQKYVFRLGSARAVATRKKVADRK